MNSYSNETHENNTIYRKWPYITRIDAISAPVCSQKSWAKKKEEKKPKVWEYNAHQLLTRWCGEQIHE